MYLNLSAEVFWVGVVLLTILSAVLGYYFGNGVYWSLFAWPKVRFYEPSPVSPPWIQIWVSDSICYHVCPSLLRTLIDGDNSQVFEIYKNGHTLKMSLSDFKRPQKIRAELIKLQKQGV